MGIGDFFFGSPGKMEQLSSLTGSQMGIQNQLERAARGRGAGGGFGTTADYYRDLLSMDPRIIEEFSAPELRRFREDIVPDIAEQFAGMGAGGLSSSGFRNALGYAGTDLAERLAAMRQNLRMQGAQGLQSLSSQALVPHSQWQQTQAPTEGFLSNVGRGIGQAIPGFLAGGPLGAAGGFISGMLSKSGATGGQTPSFGSTSPYGNQGGYRGTFGSLPNFGQRF